MTCRKLLLSLVLLLPSLYMACGYALSSQNNYIEGSTGLNAYYAGAIGTKGTAGTAGVNGYSFSAAIGHFFSNYTALEGGLLYTDFTQKATGEYKQVDLSLTIPYLATRFNVPLGQTVFIIPKIGLMIPVGKETHVRNNDTKETKTAGIVLPFVGIGLGAHITRQLDLSIQFQGAIFIIASAGSLGASLTYHF